MCQQILIWTSPYTHTPTHNSHYHINMHALFTFSVSFTCLIHFLTIVYTPACTHTHTQHSWHSTGVEENDCNQSGLMTWRSSCAYCISSWNRHITQTGEQCEQLSRFLSKSLPHTVRGWNKLPPETVVSLPCHLHFESVITPTVWTPSHHLHPSPPPVFVFPFAAQTP